MKRSGVDNRSLDSRGATADRYGKFKYSMDVIGVDINALHEEFAPYRSASVRRSSDKNERKSNRSGRTSCRCPPNGRYVNEILQSLGV